MTTQHRASLLPLVLLFLLAPACQGGQSPGRDAAVVADDASASAPDASAGEDAATPGEDAATPDDAAQLADAFVPPSDAGSGCTSITAPLGPVPTSARDASAVVYTGDGWLHFAANAANVVESVRVAEDGTTSAPTPVRAVTAAPSALAAVWTGTEAFVVIAIPGDVAHRELLWVRVDHDGHAVGMGGGPITLGAAVSLEATLGGDRIGVALSTSSSVQLRQYASDGTLVRHTEVDAAGAGPASIAWNAGTQQFGVVWRDTTQISRPRLLRATYDTDETPSLVAAGTDTLGAPSIVSDGVDFYVSTLHPAAGIEASRLLVQVIRPADGSLTRSFDVPATEAATGPNEEHLHAAQIGSDGELHVVYARAQSMRPVGLAYVRSTLSGDPVGSVVTVGPPAGSLVRSTEPLLGLGAQPWVSYARNSSLAMSWQRSLTTLCP